MCICLYNLKTSRSEEPIERGVKSIRQRILMRDLSMPYLSMSDAETPQCPNATFISVGTTVKNACGTRRFCLGGFPIANVCGKAKAVQTVALTIHVRAGQFRIVNLQ